MARKGMMELLTLFFLFALLVIPGALYMEIITHEFFHVYKHQDYAKEICVDFNKPYTAHVTVQLPGKDQEYRYSPEQLALTDGDIEREEVQANRAGRFFSVLYLINALVVLNWIFILKLKKP